MIVNPGRCACPYKNPKSPENTPKTHKNNNLPKTTRILSGGPGFAFNLPGVRFSSLPPVCYATGMQRRAHAALYRVKNGMGENWSNSSTSLKNLLLVWDCECDQCRDTRAAIGMDVCRGGQNGHLPPLEIGPKNDNCLENIKSADQFPVQ